MLKIVLPSFIVSVLAASPSFAIPMLGESAAQNVTNELTLYPDSVNPNLFYYMPNSSEFAIDPTSKLPEFGFTYWGLDSVAAGQTPDSSAGAYMTFSVRLTSDADQQTALQAALSDGKQISVLPIEQSLVGLSDSSSSTAGAAALSPLFSEFDFAPEAGLAEDDIGVNSIMTPIGAKVMKASIDNPQLIKFDYCYKVQGLGPDFDATITASWDRVYTDFQAHASIGNWWFHADIATEVEKLIQENVITITINGGDATDAEYVESMAEQIVAKLFVPELADQPVSNGGASGWPFVAVQLSYTDITELKTETWSLTRRDLIERNFCLDLGLNSLSAYKVQLVKDADASN